MDQLLGELVKKGVDCYRKVSDGSVPMASLPWDCPNKGLASTVQSRQRRESKVFLCCHGEKFETHFRQRTTSSTFNEDIFVMFQTIIDIDHSPHL